MTATAGIWTPEIAVIAADGKVTATGDDANPGDTLKIHAVRDIAFACRGLAKSDEANFDLVEVIARALDTDEDIEKRIARASDALEQEAPMVYECTRTSDPVGFDKYVRNKPLYAFLAIAHRRPGALMFAAEFGDNQGKIEGRHRAFHVNPDTPRFARHLSSPDDATQARFLEAHKDGELEANPVAYAKAFIRTAIKDTPDGVGEPIQAVKATSRGLVWVPPLRK